MLACLTIAVAADFYAGNAYYWGDLHAHSGYSKDARSVETGDCFGECGSQAALIDTARANGLDFLAVPDHVNGDAATDYPQATEADYAALVATLLAANDPEGGFVTLPAGEVMLGGVSGLGHRTLLYFGDDEALAALTRSDGWPSGTVEAADSDDCALLDPWLRDLEARFGPVMAIPHHPSAHNPGSTDWGCHQPAYAPAVEVYSEQGNALTEAPLYDPPLVTVLGDRTVHAALDPEGYALRLGFVGGTDRHDTRPGETCVNDQAREGRRYAGGLTAVVLDEGAAFDRAAIHAAITRRRTYATSGPLLPVHLAWESGGATLGGLGDAVLVPVGQPAELAVTVPEELAAAVIAVGLVDPDGEVTALVDDAPGRWTHTLVAGAWPGWAYVQVHLDGEAWYGEGCDDGGADPDEYLWLSPNWFAEGPGDVDQDGTSWLDGDCDDGDPGIGPHATETWYDGVDQDCAGVSDYDADADGHDADPWGADCDDTRADVHPGTPDPPYDDLDADCGGEPEDDLDRDGVPRAEDCDDLDPDVSPGATETWYDGVDQDCDGRDDDRDGDGFVAAIDCDDADPARHPGRGGLADTCEPPPRGCASAGSPDLLLNVTAILLVRRRRRVRRPQWGWRPGAGVGYKPGESRRSLVRKRQGLPPGQGGAGLSSRRSRMPWFGMLGLVGTGLASESFEGMVYYVGDLHAHTGVSGDAATAADGTCWGACGDQADIITTAKANGMDFVAFTDHTNGSPTTAFPYGTAEEYAELLATVLAADQPGSFVTIPAAEVWFRYTGSTNLGHKNLLMFGDTAVLADFEAEDTWPTGVVNYESIDDCAEIDAWMDGLEGEFGPTLLLPHHTSATVPMATDLSCIAEGYEVALEVYSVHGSYLYGSPAYDPPTKGITPASAIENAIDPAGWGLRVGFWAGTDRHDTLPGEVCLYDQYKSQHQYGGGLTIAVLDPAETFERKALYYALLERRTYATSGPMIPVALAWEVSGQEKGGLGVDLELAEGNYLDVDVRVPIDAASAILGVDVVGPDGFREALGDVGQGVWQGSLDLSNEPSYLYVEALVDGDAWWGMSGCTDGGDTADEYLWLSPSWITYVPEPTASPRALPRAAPGHLSGPRLGR